VLSDSFVSNGLLNDQLKKNTGQKKRKGEQRKENRKENRKERKRPEIAISKVKFKKNSRGSAPGPRPPAVG